LATVNAIFNGIATKAQRLEWLDFENTERDVIIVNSVAYK